MLRTRFGTWVSSTYLAELEAVSASKKSLDIALAILSRWKGEVSPAILSKALANVVSQLGQDIFALAANDFKDRGYFCEFGAGDGLHNSNTHLLEKFFSWNGILSEPHPDFYKSALSLRNCRVEPDAVWKESGKTFELTLANELSTFNFLVESDGHGPARKKNSSRAAKVSTVSLRDMLSRNRAPMEVDFLSIDTEGSELEILHSVPFNDFRFNAVCVEHNFRTWEPEIDRLMSDAGYARVMHELSEFDAWFVPDSAADRFA